jgi:hypothetical protein
MWNGFNFGGGTTPGNDFFRLDVGGYNPLLGRSYGEIAAESRSQHKSQGFGVAAVRGESIESFKLVAGNMPEKDIMDGVETGWSRVKDGERIQMMIDSVTERFELLHPERSVPGLVKIYQYLQSNYLHDQLSKDRNLSDNNNWKSKKSDEIRELILQCSGLFLDATTSSPFAVQTDSIRINFSMNNRLGVDAKLMAVQLDKFDTNFNQVLEKNRNFNLSKTIHVPLSKPISQPYWLVNKMEDGYFNVKDQTLIGQPDVDPPYMTIFQITIAGEPFSFFRPVKYKFTDPVRGELYQPLFVIPSSTVMTAPSMLLFQKGIPGKQEKTAGIQFNANTSIQPPVKIEFRSQRELKEKNSSSPISRNNSRLFEFKFDAPGSKAPETEKYYSLAHYMAKKDTVDIHKAIRAINYDHIPSIKYFFTDYLKVLNIDLAIYNKRIGYIPGAGDKVPEALEQMGYEVVILGDKELARNNLAQFDAIITGVRAYNTNEWMNDHYEKLMNYVNEGGNMIVQYNTSSNIGPVRAKIGPYSFNISRTRVTDENSPVQFLKPEHAVLNFPNKITSEDFKGWIQERSIYHAADWDKEKFETILSMNDPGESTDPGSLIIAKHGKGFFTYTGLVFFRELPAAVPGAYRLIANIIALNRKKGF